MKKNLRHILIIALVVVLCVPTLLLLGGCDDTYVYEGIHYTIHSDYAEVNYFITEGNQPLVCVVPSEVEYEGKVYPVTNVEPHYGFFNPPSNFVEGGYAVEIVLPETVTMFDFLAYDDIRHYTYSEFLELEKITVHPDNEVYSSVDGVLFDADGEEMLFYPQGKKEETFTVPKTMQVINDDSLFWVNKHLKNIEVEADSDYFKSVDGILYSADGVELVYRPANDEVDYFVIPPTVSVVGSGALPDVKYLFVPESVTLFLDSFVYSENSVKYVDYVYFESDTLPNYLTESDFLGRLYFGQTLAEFEEALGQRTIIE